MRTTYFLKILYYNTVFNIGETIIWFKEEKQFRNKKNIEGSFLITVRFISPYPVRVTIYQDTVPLREKF
jgi:hypothetical protein